MTFDELPPGWNCDAFLDDLRTRDGIDGERPICTHDRLLVIDAPRGGFEDDHETASVSCIDCSGLFVATIWAIDRPTELRAMTPAERARFVPLSEVEV